MKLLGFLLLLLSIIVGTASAAPSKEQLAKWLKQYPKADADGDGALSVAEAIAYREKMTGGGARRRGGPPKTFKVDPGWEAENFPTHSMCYCSPEKLKEIHPKVVSYKKPQDGGLRIVGTGHSFMTPGYDALPAICRRAGFDQPLLTHTGGGMTGSARYKWEQENGIFQFEGKAKPKLLTSIANAEWDAMMWGPYYNDRPEYYACWIDFCLKHNPQMKFFLSDAWPSIQQLEKTPKSEDELGAEVFTRLGNQKREQGAKLMAPLNESYPDKVFVIPTSDAMVLAVQAYHRGELPGIEGVHRSVGKKEHSLWRDPLGHLGPGLERLEGYVFYATLYRKSPELIEGDVDFDGGSSHFPSSKLDRVFRKIAWQAVVNHPMSGVSDKDGDGIGDR